jgi:ankyrin repeat protein
VQVDPVAANGINGRGGFTPLMLAAAGPELESGPAVLELLLQYGADPRAPTARDHQEPLHYAASPAVAALLLAHAPTGERSAAPLEARDKPGGAAPLHVAARNGRAELTRWLVEAGADLNAQLLARVGPHEAGETPLLCAARHGHQEVAGYLLDHGATVAAPGEARLSALHVCPDPADPDPATAAEAVKFVTFLFQRKAHQPCRARCVRCKLKAKLCAAVCLCAQAS